MEILNETIVAEIKLYRKNIFFVLSYPHPHPNQSAEEFEEYMNSLQGIYDRIQHEKTITTIIAGDFNARSSLFWGNDIETTEGRLFNNVVISNNLEGLINEQTHIRNDGSQSCIGLICTDRPYFFTDTDVLSSLDTHSKHIISYGNINFNFPCPPPYKRKIWDYKS